MFSLVKSPFYHNVHELPWPNFLLQKSLFTHFLITLLTTVKFSFYLSKDKFFLRNNNYVCTVHMACSPLVAYLKNRDAPRTLDLNFSFFPIRLRQGSTFSFVCLKNVPLRNYLYSHFPPKVSYVYVSARVERMGFTYKRAVFLLSTWETLRSDGSSQVLVSL